MRIFITGATGFIGRHLCRALVKLGHQPIALVRSPNKAAVLGPGVEIFPGDLGIFADDNTNLPPADVIVHLAGLVAAQHLQEYEDINYTAVEQLLACIARQSWQPRRLLFASSLAAAGPSPIGHAWTETDTPRPVEPYGAAKARAEKLVAAAPFPTTIFRPPIVLGPEDEASFTLFRSGAAGFGLSVAGPPQQLSFVDVRDLVDAILLMINDARPTSHIYFTSHPDVIDTNTLWTSMAAALGRRLTVIRVPRPILWAAMKFATGFSRLFRLHNQLDEKQFEQMTAPAFVCSSAALIADLHWQPKYSLEPCLRHAAENYRAEGKSGFDAEFRR